VTINSDDPAYFPGYVLENLVAVQEAADLSRAEVEQLVRNAFEAAWVDDPTRDEYLGAVDTYLAGY
jgi:adenosine deaminase